MPDDGTVSDKMWVALTAKYGRPSTIKRGEVAYWHIPAALNSQGRRVVSHKYRAPHQAIKPSHKSKGQK